MQSPIKPPRSVLIWTALAALAVALFAGMSLLALVNGTAPSTQERTTPTPSELSPDSDPTPDLSSAGAEGTITAQPPEATGEPAEPFDSSTAVGLWLSAVSAVSALIGLASSLWLGWRKESREVAQHQLELEKARLEIRMLQQELAGAGSQTGADEARGG